MILALPEVRRYESLFQAQFLARCYRSLFQHESQPWLGERFICLMDKDCRCYWCCGLTIATSVAGALVSINGGINCCRVEAPVAEKFSSP